MQGGPLDNHVRLNCSPTIISDGPSLDKVRVDRLSVAIPLLECSYNRRVERHLAGGDSAVLLGEGDVYDALLEVHQLVDYVVHVFSFRVDRANIGGLCSVVKNFFQSTKARMNNGPKR